MNNAVLLCIVAGLCFAGAPLLGRLSAVNAMMMTVLIAVGTLIATLPVAFSQNYVAAGSKALTYALIAGVVNGIGLLAYYGLVAGANEGRWEISKVLPIPLVICPIFIAIGAMLFFHEALTTQKVIGIVLACTAIWFLK